MRNCGIRSETNARVIPSRKRPVGDGSIVGLPGALILGYPVQGASARRQRDVELLMACHFQSPCRYLLHRHGWLRRLPGIIPTSQGECIEAGSPELTHHTGARCFARSGAVGDDHLLSILIVDPVHDVSRFDANASRNLGQVPVELRSGADIKDDRRRVGLQ